MFAGTNTTFLTQYAQADVFFNGVAGYNAVQFTGFYEVTALVPVPEPSTWFAAALAFGAVAYTQRRRLCKSGLRNAECGMAAS